MITVENPSSTYLPLAQGFQPEAPERTSTDFFPAELAAFGSYLSGGKKDSLLLSFKAFYFFSCLEYFTRISAYRQAKIYELRKPKVFPTWPAIEYKRIELFIKQAWYL